MLGYIVIRRAAITVLTFGFTLLLCAFIDLQIQVELAFLFAHISNPYSFTWF